MTKYFVTILVLFFIISCDSGGTTDRKAIPNPTKNYPHVDSFSSNCLGDTNFENISSIKFDNGTLTCKLGKYENCNYDRLDTFMFHNDTLDLKIGSADGERVTCDCYWVIYVRLNYIATKPKTITVNGHNIRPDFRADKEDAKEDK
jgi:hypothetical protein